MVEIQNGVVYSSCVKCHGVDVLMSIGEGGGIHVGWCWAISLVCVGWLLGDGGCVLSSKEPIQGGLV